MNLIRFAGCVSHPFRESLETTRLAAPDHMKCCLYLSDDGVTSATGGIVGKGGSSHHMVALALKNSFDPVGNVKVRECCTQFSNLGHKVIA